MELAKCVKCTGAMKKRREGRDIGRKQREGRRRENEMESQDENFSGGTLFRLMCDMFDEISIVYAAAVTLAIFH